MSLAEQYIAASPEFAFDQIYLGEAEKFGTLLPSPNKSPKNVSSLEKTSSDATEASKKTEPKFRFARATASFKSKVRAPTTMVRKVSSSALETNSVSSSGTITRMRRKAPTPTRSGSRTPERVPSRSGNRLSSHGDIFFASSVTSDHHQPIASPPSDASTAAPSIQTRNTSEAPHQGNRNDPLHINPMRVRPLSMRKDPSQIVSPTSLAHMEGSVSSKLSPQRGHFVPAVRESQVPKVRAPTVNLGDANSVQNRRK